MAEEFDLIPAKEVSDTFKVVFDLYSPRAHFIILPRNKHTGTYVKLDQKARLKVVESAWSLVSGYKLQKLAVLSLHFMSKQRRFKEQVPRTYLCRRRRLSRYL